MNFREFLSNQFFKSFAVFLILLLPLQGYSLGDTPSVKATVETKSKGESEILMVIEIPEGYHIYSLEEDLGTGVEFDNPAIFIKGELNENSPESVFDEALGGIYKVHKGFLRLSATLNHPQNIENFSGKFIYRICNGLICSLKRTVNFRSDKSSFIN